MKIRDLLGTPPQEIWDKEFGELRVDREEIMMYGLRYRTSVRMALGLFYTPEEYEEYRKEVLSKPLP